MSNDFLNCCKKFVEMYRKFLELSKKRLRNVLQMCKDVKEKQIEKMACMICSSDYAQNSILVNLILVNFFTFLIIARNPPKRFWRSSVEIFPTSVPELLKPSRDLLELRKSKF